MDITLFRERMKQLLLQLPDAKLASGGKEITLRCRYCGDSRTKSSRHMYIQLPTGASPMYYNCYRVNCDAKGIVTWDKLQEWGVNLSEQDIKDVIEYNKFINKNSNYIFKDKSVYPLCNSMYNVNNEMMYQEKIKYINDRLGTNFNHAQIKNRLKISLNLLELISENNLNILTQDWKLQKLAENYICFITQDNLFTVCRNIKYDPDRKDYMNYRYFKYKLFDTLDDSNRCSLYILPTNINPALPIKIYLTEGTFDIISVKYNIVRSNDNCIYCAVLGSGYIKAIEYFISTMGFINCEFHLYVDNDMSKQEIMRICDMIRPFQFKTYVHNNGFIGEKDFGVPKERIIDNSKLMIRGW